MAVPPNAAMLQRLLEVRSRLAVLRDSIRPVFETNRGSMFRLMYGSEDRDFIKDHREDLVDHSEAAKEQLTQLELLISSLIAQESPCRKVYHIFSKSTLSPTSGFPIEISARYQT